MTGRCDLPTLQEDLEHHPSYVINHLASLGQADQARLLEPTGLSLLMVRTLTVLSIEDGLTISEIAARSFSEQSTTSRTIDAMVNAGLLERRTPVGDQRRREVVLTAAGRAKMLAVWPLMERHRASLTAGIDAGDLAVCGRVLAAMIGNLRGGQG
ncbi:MarR family winged helix-turn-helix transcriptional regulator [Novosphingobium sp. SG707]|uniref:MarR family winged helix-turn-helix transcriptional regulator n=1 Tax=Novosphingobium sp. SG707 TaxID=2586996 RepID=UPI001447575B|nr:MarR family winged helix-turn-helix transcriptional regulator [Novosphingobium sp. SG707]NKI98089.1 DNA-binding MarR family transcriptional regulator [Novosphingobium sp. SG707]